MKKFKLTRRNFLKNSSIGLLGTGLLFSRSRINYSPRGKKFPPQINEYRRLGRTELMVSDIGSGVPYSESVLKAVLSAGVNFIETAECYSNGRNEILIANAIKNVESE